MPRYRGIGYPLELAGRLLVQRAAARWTAIALPSAPMGRACPLVLRLWRRRAEAAAAHLERTAAGRPALRVRAVGAELPLLQAPQIAGTASCSHRRRPHSRPFLHRSRPLPVVIVLEAGARLPGAAKAAARRGGQAKGAGQGGGLGGPPGGGTRAGLHARRGGVGGGWQAEGSTGVEPPAHSDGAAQRKKESTAPPREQRDPWGIPQQAAVGLLTWRSVTST